jgi:hypothetical protein
MSSATHSNKGLLIESSYEGNLSAIHNVRNPNKGPLSPTLSPLDGAREKNAKALVVVYDCC